LEFVSNAKPELREAVETCFQKCICQGFPTSPLLPILTQISGNLHAHFGGYEISEYVSTVLPESMISLHSLNDLREFRQELDPILRLGTMHMEGVSEIQLLHNLRGAALGEDSFRTFGERLSTIQPDSPNFRLSQIVLQDIFERQGIEFFLRRIIKYENVHGKSLGQKFRAKISSGLSSIKSSLPTLKGLKYGMYSMLKHAAQVNTAQISYNSGDGDSGLHQIRENIGDGDGSEGEETRQWESFEDEADETETGFDVINYFDDPWSDPYSIFMRSLLWSVIPVYRKLRPLDPIVYSLYNVLKMTEERIYNDKELQNCDPLLFLQTFVTTDLLHTDWETILAVQPDIRNEKKEIYGLAAEYLQEPTLSMLDQLRIKDVLPEIAESVYNKKYKEPSHTRLQESLAGAKGSSKAFNTAVATFKAMIEDPLTKLSFQQRYDQYSGLNLQVQNSSHSIQDLLGYIEKQRKTLVEFKSGIMLSGWNDEPRDTSSQQELTEIVEVLERVILFLSVSKPVIEEILDILRIVALRCKYSNSDSIKPENLRDLYAYISALGIKLSAERMPTGFDLSNCLEQLRSLLPRAVKSICDEVRGHHPVVPAVASTEELTRAVIQLINSPCHDLEESCQVEAYLCLNINRLLLISILRKKCRSYMEFCQRVQEWLNLELNEACTCSETENEKTHLTALKKLMGKLNDEFRKYFTDSQVSSNASLQERWKLHLETENIATLIPLLREYAKTTNWESHSEMEHVSRTIYVQALKFHPNDTAKKSFDYESYPSTRVRIFETLKNLEGCKQNPRGWGRISRALHPQHADTQTELDEVTILLASVRAESDYEQFSQALEKDLVGAIGKMNLEDAFTLMDSVNKRLSSLSLSSAEMEFIQMKHEIDRLLSPHNQVPISKLAVQDPILSPDLDPTATLTEILTQFCLGYSTEESKLTLECRFNEARDFAVYRGEEEAWIQIAELMMSTFQHFKVRLTVKNILFYFRVQHRCVLLSIS
jgi:hypothetical protein